MKRPIAHISVDLDPVDTHLAGYGLTCAPCDRIYRGSVPRILELLDRVGVKATFFVVARDAEREAFLLREVASRGHEIASHSVTHPIPFATLPAAVIDREVRESRQRLEDAVGHAVVGFRAPGWDVNSAALAAIAAAGYRYDASVLPSPALALGAALRWLLSVGRMRPTKVSNLVGLAFSSRLRYRVGDLWEFPLSVSPWLRAPFTHTLWYLAPRGVCRHIYCAIRRSGGPLCYQFHAADLLDLGIDHADSRMARHPGMRWPLARKAALLEGVLRDIAAEYVVMPYASALDALADAHAPVVAV